MGCSISCSVPSRPSRWWASSSREDHHGGPARRRGLATGPFIDRVIDGGPDAVTAPDDALSVRDYLDPMLAGSFREPSRRMPAAARRRWFAGYVEQMVTRDVPAVAPRRDPELLRRYLSVFDYEPRVQPGDRGRRHAAVRN